MCPYISNLWCTCIQTGNLDSGSLAKSRSSWSSAGLPLHSCIKFAYPSQWRKARYWLSWFAQIKALAVLKSTDSWWFATGQEHEWIRGKGALETEETVKNIVGSLETRRVLKAILEAYHPFCWSSHGVGTKEYYKLDTRALLTAVLCHSEHALEFNTFMYSDQESELILLD